MTANATKTKKAANPKVAPSAPVLGATAAELQAVKDAETARANEIAELRAMLAAERAKNEELVAKVANLPVRQTSAKATLKAAWQAVDPSTYAAEDTMLGKLQRMDLDTLIGITAKGCRAMRRSELPAIAKRLIEACADKGGFNGEQTIDGLFQEFTTIHTRNRKKPEAAVEPTA